MWYKIIIVLGFLFLNACSHNKMALHLYRDQLSTGTSSLEIFKKYGPATQMWHDGQGNVYSYNYAKPHYNFLSFLPVPLFKSRFDNYEVVLVFDGDGRLQDIKKFHNHVMVKSWLICEFGEVDCEISRNNN